MSGDISIRACEPKDAAELWGFRTRAKGKLGIFEHLANSFANMEEVCEFLSQCYLPHMVTPSRAVAALRCGSEIVGVGFVAVASREPPVAEIAGYVLPEMRGLIDASKRFIEWADGLFPGYTFEAETGAFNAPALQALRSAGFKVVDAASGVVRFSRC